jgi:hypothetical protein
MRYAVDESLLSLQELASGEVAMEELNIDGMDGCVVAIRMGRLATTAFTAAVNFRVEVSPDNSGNRWNSVQTLSTQLGSSVADEAVSGTVAAGVRVVTVASTTGLAVGDVVYFDNSTVANSEWGRIKSIVTDTSITLEDLLANAQTGATIYDQAEIYAPVPVDLRGLRRIRVVADGSGGGQAFAVEARIRVWGN